MFAYLYPCSVSIKKGLNINDWGQDVSYSMIAMLRAVTQPISCAISLKIARHRVKRTERPLAVLYVNIHKVQ